MHKSVPVCSIPGNLTKSSKLTHSWKDNHHHTAYLRLNLVIIITANCLFNKPLALALEQFLYNPTFDIRNSGVCEVCKHIWSGNSTYRVCTCCSEFAYPRVVIDHNSILLVNWMIYVFIKCICYSASYAFNSIYLLSQLLLLAQDIYSTDIYREEFSLRACRKLKATRIPPKLKECFFLSCPPCQCLDTEKFKHLNSNTIKYTSSVFVFSVKLV